MPSSKGQSRKCQRSYRSVPSFGADCEPPVELNAMAKSRATPHHLNTLSTLYNDRSQLHGHRANFESVLACQPGDTKVGTSHQR